MAKQISEGNKPTRRRRRKPAPPKDSAAESESTTGITQEPASPNESPVFVYTYTVWNRFPSGRDN